MMPSVPAPLLAFLRGGDTRASLTTGLVLLALMLVVLIGHVTLQGAATAPRRDALRVFAVVSVPLLLVFAAIVVMRFHDLS
jgi:hypothetical protein